MLGTAWLTLRQAQEALKNGRLEEAQRLLSQSGAQGHRRSWNLLQQLARGYDDAQIEAAAVYLAAQKQQP